MLRADNNRKICLLGLLFVTLNFPRFVYSEAIVADHNAVKDFDIIPSCWIDAAKELTMHYAHTSHGGQVISGLGYIESYIDPVKYSFARRTSSSSAGLPNQEDPPAFRMYDGNPPETYIRPEDYWDGDSAMNRTRAVADTGDYNYSMWSWCGQQSSNTVTTVNRYLSNLNTFETEYASMRFIYMTGHTDGGSDELARNNQMVRDYVIQNDKVLFDFADIESYDPDGNYYPTTDDGCRWCTTWCNDNPDDCQNLPSCNHSHGYNCKMKGKAFWWMMARLAGWNGQANHDCNSTAELFDVIKSLQTVSDSLADPVDAAEVADQNGDNKIGLADAISILRQESAGY